MPTPKYTRFITKYAFTEDKTKTGRVLESVRVGGVFITRIAIEPEAVVGNLYYVSTNLIFFLERGKIKTKFVQINTGEEKETVLSPGDGITHVPPCVGFGMINLSKKSSIIILFSDMSLKNGDDVAYRIY